jgi:hypothetical protein
MLLDLERPDLELAHLGMMRAPAPPTEEPGGSYVITPDGYVTTPDGRVLYASEGGEGA